MNTAVPDEYHSRKKREKCAAKHFKHLGGSDDMPFSI
jgi:hypothetical protein